MKLRGCLLWATLLVGAFPVWGREFCTPPVPVRNQLPIASIFLELTALSPCVIPPGTSHTEVMAQYSNSSIEGEENGALLRIDHERFDGRVVARFGLPGNSDLAIAFGYVADGAGSMDSFIRRFHQAAGLGSGNRETRPDGLYGYILHWTDTGEGIALTEPPSGASEPVVTFHRRAGEFNLWWLREVIWGWRVAGKLPLPGISPAIGTGAPDFGAGVMLDGYLDTPWGRLGMYGNAGAAFFSDAPAIPFTQYHRVPMGTGGFSLPVFPDWALFAQWQLAGPRYPYPPLHKLARFQSILAMGGRYRLRNGTLAFGITEDPTVASEDFGLFLVYRPEPN